MEQKNYELGTELECGGRQWIIVRLTDDRVYLALDHIPFSVPFGKTNVYKDSALAKCAAAFERNLSADALKDTVETTVEGVTSKVFVPTCEMISEFDWFKDLEHRNCKDDTGYSSNWWTASPDGDGYVYCVYTSGSIIGSTCPAHHAFGFRPFVCLKR